MNSKVVKWFKRQASIRRYSSDKTDEKTPSNSTSEEKRKHNFPKLSFRKKNKRKGDKGGEFEGALSVIGISKKFSLSVPKEMEANTKEPVAKVPISSSVNFGSISLTNSPNKTDGYNGASAVSYHSSFDYSKENTDESISLSEAEAAKPILTEKEVSEMSKNSHYDNIQSFHPANNSSHTTSNTSYLGRNHKTDSRHDNAPIVKMDDICDINSDKEHPEDIQSSSTNDSVKVSHNAIIETSDYGDPSSHTSDKIYEDLCDRSLEEHLVDNKCEETELFIKEEMDTNDIQIEKKDIDENKGNVFEEIDRLVRDATSLTEDEMIKMDTRDDTVSEHEVPLNIIEADPRDEKKIEKNDSDNIEENNDLNDSTSENITILSTDESSNSCLVLSQPETSNEVVQEGEQTVKFETDCRDNNINYNDGDQTIPQKMCKDIQNEIHINDVHINKDIDKSSKLEKEIELVIKEESELNDNNNSDRIKKEVVNDELNNSRSSYTEFSPSVQIVLTQSSPVKNTEIAKTLIEQSPSKASVTQYPKELNPFGDDDSDSADEIVNATNENIANRNVSPIPRTRITKENGVSHVGRVTSNNIGAHTKYVNERSLSPMRGIVSSPDSHENKCTEGNSIKSSNPFGDSDDEGVSSLNSTNPFDEEDEEVAAFGNSPSSRTIRETPPNLPPKSFDLQSRKNSHGSLAPIPIPRRSKQSLHGSYTSLQNVSTAPIPAPRSITPFGSTKTLNLSNNPFDDDDTENSFGDFERRGVGRSSMQVLPVSVSEDHLSRTGVRGSLPPSAKLKLGKKKRPAPLPPGFSQRKQHLYPSLSDFSSLPRKRSSTSPASGGRNFDSKTSREISPHRLPPPRPPPPKINF